MSNVIKFVKKAFTFGVVSTTILWSSMVSVLVPTVASAASPCPTLNPGDMIKVKGKAAIYAVNNDGKVLYFPSGDEFKSWRESYGGYATVTQECFDSLSVPSTYPGAVNYRPGSYVVKRPSSDQLYVVEPGNTLAKVTPEAAKALYGASYKVMTVADAFWPHYVNRGADVTEAKAHAGMLVSNGGKTWYVDKDMKVWEVSASGMTANMFMAKFVHAVADSAVAGLVSGGKLDAELKALTDKTQSGGVSAPVPGPVASGSLSVALASDNPFAATIVSDSGTNGAQAMIPVLKLVLTAGSDGDAKVTSLKLKRGGVSADTDIANMYLFDGDMMVASNPGVANNMVNFSNSAGLFTVAKGSSKTIVVKLDLKNATSAGKTFMFSVNAKEDVMPVASGGSFPVASNTFTSASVTDLGKLVLSNVTPTAAGTVDPGTTNFEIWKFKAVNSNQDTELRKLKVTLVGSINAGDLKNFSLWDGGAQIGSTVAEMASDKTVIFDFSAAPYLVTKGQTKNLSLRADVVAGTNRTFYASIQNSGDIVSFDKNYGVYLKSNATDSFTIVQPVTGGGVSVSWTVNTGNLVPSLAPDSPTGNVASSSVNVVLAKFNWKASGEDIKITALSVSSTISTNSANLKNVRLLVNGSQVGSTISTLQGNGAVNTSWGSFGNSFIVKAGTTAVVTIQGDLTDSTIGAGMTVVIGFPAASVSPGSANYQGMVSLTTGSTVAETGNTLTVKGGTVNVAVNTSFGNKSSGNPNGPLNATAAKVASFIVTAGAGEQVTVSQIVLEDGAGEKIGTNLQNLMLKNSSTGAQLGQTISSPSTGAAAGTNTHTFNISPAVAIASGAQLIVDVYADLKATYTTGVNLVRVYSVAASGAITGADASNSTVVALQNNYISGSGAFMVQADPDTAINNHYLMGSTDSVVGKFKITASSTEAVNITQLVVSAKFGSGATGTMTNIRLVDDSGAQVGPAVSAFSDTVAGTSAATTTYSHATFSGLNLQIPKGQSKVLSLKVDFTTYENGGFSTTAQTFEPAILATYYGVTGNNPITATGASSGASLTANVVTSGTVNDYTSVGAGAYAATGTMYRARLTTAYAGDTPSGAASPSSQQTVMKFVVTNMANMGSYVATVQNVDFDLSTTLSITAGNSAALTVYKDSITLPALATTSFGGSTNQNFTNTTLTESSFTDVQISSGAAKTFIVTLDTSNAATYTSKSLSVRIGGSDVTWTDGLTSNTKMAELPLTYKTFTY